MTSLPVKKLLTVGAIFAIFCVGFILYGNITLLFDSMVNQFSKYAYIYVTVTISVSFLSALFIKTKPSLYIILLFVLSFICVLVIALWAETEPVSDFSLLYSLSNSLKNCDFVTLKSNSYFQRWAYQSFFVIYQMLVISIFPGGITPLLVFNALFMANIIVLIYLISRISFKEKTARIISTLYLFYPAPLFLASVLTNQHISLFFVLLGVYIFIKNTKIKNYVIGGCLLAVGNALRPDGIIVIASICILIIVILISHKAKALKLMIPYLGVITSVILTGAVISAIVIMTGVNPNGQKNLDPLWKFVTGLNIETNGGYSNELGNKIFRIKDAAERHQLEMEIVKQHLSVDSVVLRQFLFDKTCDTWASYENTNWAFSSQDERNVPFLNRPLKRILVILQQADRLYFMLIVCAVLVSLIYILFQKKTYHLSVLCVLCIVLFFCIYIFIEVQARYRYFIYPFMFIATGTAFDQFLNVKLRSTEKR